MTTPSRHAFSLVELLVVIAVIGLITSIALVAHGNVRGKAAEVKGASLMRENGKAISLYLTDNGDVLPGPLWPGQMALYTPGRSGRLINELATYLDLPTQGSEMLMEAFIPPAYREAVEDDALPSARIYVMNDTVTVNDVDYRPFGFPARDDNPATAPMRRSALPPEVLDIWMMTDADQEHPNVSGKFWGQFTPEAPIYGDFRHVLFFDGRVGRVPVDAR